MKIAWHSDAWEDYVWWQTNDKKTVKRINELMKDILRHPFDGLGKTEALKHSFQGYFSRRINSEHRLVYTLRDSVVVIAQCRYHY